MEQFTAFDLQRRIGKVQAAALAAPVAITHHGHGHLVLMNHDQWRRLGRGDALAEAIRRLQANRALLRREEIAGISVFGSVARGDARDDSDIDLLVEPRAGTRVGGLKLARWKNLMTALLGRNADVVVREFLDDKVRLTIERDLIEAVTAKSTDALDAN